MRREGAAEEVATESDPAEPRAHPPGDAAADRAQSGADRGDRDQVPGGAANVRTSTRSRRCRKKFYFITCSPAGGDTYQLQLSLTGLQQSGAAGSSTWRHCRRLSIVTTFCAQRFIGTDYLNRCKWCDGRRRSQWRRGWRYLGRDAASCAKSDSILGSTSWSTCRSHRCSVYS